MSKITGIPISKIKYDFGIPIDETYQAETICEARAYFLEITSGYGPDLEKIPDEILEKALPVLKVWVELYILDVWRVKKLARAKRMLKECPPDSIAKEEIIKKIATLYGVTQENFCLQKLSNAVTLEEAILIAFKSMPLDSKLVGPKGELLFMRNDVPLDSRGFMAELDIKSTDKTDHNILFAACWRLSESEPTIILMNESKLSDWQNRW
ncbi:MAG: hypothetical protein ACOYMB_03310 [Patescibacteria group bacterium]